MTATIQDVSASSISDSRGKKTLRVVVRTEHSEGAFEVPSGASTGEREAHELRDEDGGVETAIRKVSDVVAPALRGMPIDAQTKIDDVLLTLDGTPQKTNLGGNSMVGVSIAVAKAAAGAAGIPVFEYVRTLGQVAPSRRAPYLFVNLINGGKHAKVGSSFQEHHVIPDTEDVAEAIKMANNIYTALGEILGASGKVVSEGDEGGYAFPVTDVFESFQFLADAVEKAGCSSRVFIGADIAASSFAREGTYDVLGTKKSAEELKALYCSIQQRFGLRFIEDPFDENAGPDFASFRASTKNFTVIGDDLTTTSAERIEASARNKEIDAVIIKPNQIGTLTETIAAMRVARESGIECIVSHRSGETMDDFIADLAYAFQCFGLKAGAPHMPERRVKYERLANISHA